IEGDGPPRCPERRELFPDMKVIDNLEMGAYSRVRTVEMRRDLDRIYSLFPILAERRKNRAGALSGGQQQMLATRVDVASAPALARRAYARVGAFDRETNLRDAANAEPRWDDNSPDRAKCQSSAKALRVFLHSGKWPDRSGGEEHCSQRRPDRSAFTRLLWKQKKGDGPMIIDCHVHEEN